MKNNLLFVNLNLKIEIEFSLYSLTTGWNRKT
jgi:hypothetical protein